MAIRYYRFFGTFLDVQERWLNKMAAKGYRLVRTGKLLYEFEKCPPDKFIYCIEFIGHRSVDDADDYRRFLEDMGYRVFVKNINLNYSIGKVRYRPWAEKGARLSTNSTTINRELFIVEKENDGKPFELHTTSADRANYYAVLRNVWLWPFLAFGLLAVLFLLIGLDGAMIFGVFSLIFLIPFLIYQSEMRKYKRNADIRE